MEKQEKISEAFPEVNEDSTKFRSNVHQRLSDQSYKIDENSFVFQAKILKEEIEIIKNYHNEWFPIKYSDRFYEDLFHQKRTQIIVLKADIFFEKENKKEQIIIGLITYRIQDAEPLYLGFVKKLKSFFGSYKCAHICTLGVLYEFRKLNIGTKILNYLEQQILSKIEIEYIYLETTTYNKAALNFYQKNGYSIQRCTKNFYFFNDNHYDACFLFKKAINQTRQYLFCVLLSKYQTKISKVIKVYKNLLIKLVVFFLYVSNQLKSVQFFKY